MAFVTQLSIMRYIICFHVSDNFSTFRASGRVGVLIFRPLTFGEIRIHLGVGRGSSIHTHTQAHTQIFPLHFRETFRDESVAHI